MPTIPNSQADGMCPQCGSLFPMTSPLVPHHDQADSTECEGSEQNWRNPWSDARPLWNGRPNPNIAK